MVKSSTNEEAAKYAKNGIDNLQEQLEAFQEDVAKNLRATLADALQKHPEPFQ